MTVNFTVVCERRLIKKVAEGRIAGLSAFACASIHLILLDFENLHHEVPDARTHDTGEICVTSVFSKHTCKQFLTGKIFSQLLACEL